MTDRALPKADVGSHDRSYGGLQLLAEYKKKLDPKFLEWYLKEFGSTRMVYVHWSAGPWGVNFLDYHMMILKRGNQSVIQNNTRVVM